MLKKQHVKKLKTTFEQQKKELNTFKKLLEQNIIPEKATFKFNADFETLPAFTVPIELLKNHLFEKISANEKMIVLVSTLSQYVSYLDSAIQMRNSLIEKFKNSGPLPPEILAPLYFGLRNPAGHTNNEYPSTLEAISLYTDDVIFFSNMLCKELNEYGVQLKNRIPKNPPKITQVKFDIPENEGLMPPTDQYENWLRIFKDKKPS